MIKCNKCGSLILKIKLKKHQESNKCKKSPKSKSIRRKILMDDDTDDENDISSSSTKSDDTPIKRKRKRNIIDDDSDDDDIPSSPKSISSSPKSISSSPKSISSSQTLSPIIRRQRKNIITEDSDSEEEEIEKIKSWDELKNKLIENNLIVNEDIDNQSFKKYDLIKRMIFDKYCIHYGNIIIDNNSNNIFNFDEHGFVDCLKMYNCESDIKNPVSFDNNDEFIVSSIEDEFLVFISIKENSIKYYFDLKKQELQFIEKDVFDFQIENIDMDEIDNLLNKSNKNIFEYFLLLILKKYNIFSKPSINSLTVLNNYFNSQILSFPKIQLVHFALNDKIFIEDYLNLSKSNNLIFDFSKIEKNTNFLSFLNNYEEKDEEEEEEEEKEEEEEEEKEEEEEEEKEEEEEEEEEEDEEEEDEEDDDKNEID